MVRVASLFSQLLAHFPRGEFQEIVVRHRGDRGAKGFTCWTQFVSMVFCHVARADSLREICYGLAGCVGKLRHLGVMRIPRKSTLSYANEHRSSKIYEDLFWAVLQRFRSDGLLGPRAKPLRFRNKLLSFDSTTVSLCLNLFPWAKFRRAKGGVKVHVLLDHGDYMPAFVHISEARRHDRMAAHLLKLPAGSIITCDRAYNDYGLFSQWTEAGVFFVTRLKENAVFEVVDERPVPQNRNILRDQTIRLAGVGAPEKCPHLLRRVVVWDAKNERELVLLTNHLNFGATTVADTYRQRWQIEVFFKTLKQNLKIKTFIGVSENALRIQIWTALIALLLLRFLHHLSKARWSLSNLAAQLRLNLFTYRDLQQWIDDPFNMPPVEPVAAAGQDFLPGLGQVG